MKKNEGFSLVELIVVITILAVLSTGVIMGVGMLGSWQLNECVSLLDGGLNETRTEALSKQAAYLTISCDESGSYYMEVTGKPIEKLAGDKITITYATDAGEAEVAITPEQPLVLSYDRASGAFLPMKDTEVYCTAIHVRLGDGKSTTIRLVKSTGKHTIE